MLKWQKPHQSRKEIRLSEIGKELDFIEMQIQNPKLLRPVFQMPMNLKILNDAHVYNFETLHVNILNSAEA